MNGLAIAVTGLKKSYPGGVTALDGLDLAVEPGTVFGLLGPNGAGKTTTVKILTTLSRPDEGQALVAGYDVLTRPQAVRRSIGSVAQRSGADPQATGRENLMLQARVQGLSRAEATTRTTELMARYGLTDAADRVVKTWSGGMRRRLDVALALIHRPAVLFLDEPTTGLDPEARGQMWDEIRRLRTQDGVTILLTTHYLDEADQLSDRLAIVHRGKVVTEGTPNDLKDELEGDGVQVELDPEASLERAADVVSGLDGLRDILVEGRTLHARARRGSAAIPQLLSTLEAEGLTVWSASVTRPSLDEVFLRHTGTTFTQVEEEVTQ